MFILKWVGGILEIVLITIVLIFLLKARREESGEVEGYVSIRTRRPWSAGSLQNNISNLSVMQSKQRNNVGGTRVQPEQRCCGRKRLVWLDMNTNLKHQPQHLPSSARNHLWRQKEVVEI